MPLTVRSRTENEIAILDLEGPLTLGPSLHLLRDATRDVLSKGPLRGIVLNMADVTATDSAGLGEMTVVYTLASKVACRVLLIGVKSSLKSMLEVTHLDALMPSTVDLAAARKLIAS